MKNEEHWQFRKATKEQAPASREQKLHICRQSTSHSLSRAPVGAELGVGRVGDAPSSDRQAGGRLVHRMRMCEQLSRNIWQERGTCG